MTVEACIMEACATAHDKGFVAGSTGEPSKPEPCLKDYQHGWMWVSANRYHEHWMTGWKEGRKFSDESNERTKRYNYEI